VALVMFDEWERVVGGASQARQEAAAMNAAACTVPISNRRSR
jgi:hypothetical protein